MNLQETLALIEALKSAGVTKFHSRDFDIDFGARPESTSVVHTSGYIAPAPAAPTQTPAPVAAPAAEAPLPVMNADQKLATEKLQNLIDTLKLKDHELVEKIFPDGGPT